MNNNELYHYGILGMRWGVRKSSKNRTQSKDADEAEKIKKKKVSEMSNDEIQKLNRRQQLEKQHKDLNPSAIKKGLAIAGAVVAALGTITALYKYSKQGIDKGKEIVEKNKRAKIRKMNHETISNFKKGEQVVIKNKNTSISKLKVSNAQKSYAKKKNFNPNNYKTMLTLLPIKKDNKNKKK